MTNYTTTNTAAMTFSIEEHIEYTHGHYMHLGIIECVVCNISFPAICDGDPGSTEAAVGVSFVCEHPECRAITDGAGVLICGADIEELLTMNHETLSTMEDAVVECDGYDVEINPILRRREQVEIERRELGWRFAYDTDQYDRHDRDDTDLDKEKWDNYYGDYNQCGIHVSY